MAAIDAEHLVKRYGDTTVRHLVGETGRGAGRVMDVRRRQAQ